MQSDRIPPSPLVMPAQAGTTGYQEVPHES